MKSNKRRVCITGIGIVNPSGIGKNDFWDNISKGRNAISSITKFPANDFPTNVAGQLTNFKAEDFIPKRFKIKTDTFTHYAWAAANLALEDAKLDLSLEDSYRVGVWFGNNGGGWDICERGLFEMYRDGAVYVNPWQATAWFLSSPQGYLTIANNIKGSSKSFVCDRASGASALYFAMNAIQSGANDIILAGGTEAPINPFALLCYTEIDQLAPSKGDCTVYKPFSPESKGHLLAEGSTVLIFEEYEHALKRNAFIYGEIKAGAMTMDYDGKSHHALEKALNTTLTRGEVSATDIDVVFPEAAGVSNSDNAEIHAYKSVFKENLDIPMSCPKSCFGHLYGASTPTDVALGLLAGQQSLIPPAVHGYVNQTELNIVEEPIKKTVNNFMVTSRAREGSNVVLLVSNNV